MRSISLIVVGMLAYAATANPITSEKRLTCVEEPLFTLAKQISPKKQFSCVEESSPTPFNPIDSTERPICTMALPSCHCNGRTQCYHVAKPCLRGYCAPKTPSLQCSRPKCESECDKGETCIYYKPNPKEKGCGDTICARSGNSNLM